MAPIITLLTDFGSDGPYVGAMKGAILSINPRATIVDLTHDVPPGDVHHGAFLLSNAISTFPADAIHLAVVDPGVGSRRRPIAVQTERGTFVAPDNGLLSYVVEVGALPDRAGDQARAPRPHSLGGGQRAVHLLDRRFWRHPISRTFHGRDIFGPVAAHLSLGAGLDDLGDTVDQILAFPLPHAMATGPGELGGEVVFVDRFGNLVTCIREEDVQTEVRVEIAGRTINGLSPSYEEGAGLLAIVGSGGFLEIAVTNGSAARVLGAGVGTPVRVRST